jgi:hypothetical protein
MKCEKPSLQHRDKKDYEMEMALKKGGGGRSQLNDSKYRGFRFLFLSYARLCKAKQCIFYRMYPFNGSLEPPASSLSGLFLDLDDEES